MYLEYLILIWIRLIVNFKIHGHYQGVREEIINSILGVHTQKGAAVDDGEVSKNIADLSSDGIKFAYGKVIEKEVSHFYIYLILKMMLQSQLLEDYLKAVPCLTISPENRLILENQEIKYRNDMLESHKDEVILLRKEFEPLLALKHTLIKEGLLKES